MAIELTETQIEQIRLASTGYKFYALFDQPYFPGTKTRAYGVWFGHNKHGHPNKGESVRVTEQLLTINQARDVIADMLVTDIIDILNGEYEPPSKS